MSSYASNSAGYSSKFTQTQTPKNAPKGFPVGPTPGITPYGYNPTNRLDEPNYSWGSRINDYKGIIGDLRNFFNQGDAESTKRLLDGDFGVTPTFSTDPAVRQRSDQIRAEGIASGQQAADGYTRQFGGPGAGGMGVLAGLKGASLGSQGAAAYGLEEAKWRTGVEEGNQNRALQALGLAQDGQLTNRGQALGALGTAGGFVDNLLGSSMNRVGVEEGAMTAEQQRKLAAEQAARDREMFDMLMGQIGGGGGGSNPLHTMRPW